MIETEVHQRLRAYLREQGHTQWPHHLTMARLVARALRVDRSALIQIDSLAAYQGSHRLSYLIPALLWPEPAVLAVPEALIETVLQQDIPTLQQGFSVIKPVQSGDQWPHENFRGLLVTSAERWLQTSLESLSVEASFTDSFTEARPFPARPFPAGVPTLIDGASSLERWAQSFLNETLGGQDWETLMLAYPGQQSFIRDMRVRITHAIFQHPANPYACHLIEAPEKTLLLALFDGLQAGDDSEQMPPCWQRFWQRFSQVERLAWSSLDRDMGSVALHCGPTDINSYLAPLWEQQPVVLIGAALDEETQADRYRDRMGLSDMTCLNFGPDRRNDEIQLYLPDKLPMPNTSHFKEAVLQEIRALISARGLADDPTVILIGDVPLKAQFAAILAAEFGSRVQLESPVSAQGILIAGWDYWRQHKGDFSAPHTIPGLLIITTLPIPSLENPLVAGRVATYKKRRQDWFKAYLLPEALSTLQHAVAPLRSRSGSNERLRRDSVATLRSSANGALHTRLSEKIGVSAYAEPLPSSELSQSSHSSQGIVALLDNRVNYRSYGAQVLAALSPAARSSYLNEDWFPGINTDRSLDH